MKRGRHVATLLALATLAAPAALAAQQPTANPVTASFESFGGHYAGWLLAAFDSIPAGRYDFRPTPSQQSVGFIAQHLEHANYALCERVGGIKASRGSKDSLADTVKARWPKDTLVARLRASLLFCRDAFTRVNDARLADLVPIDAGGSAPPQPLARALLYFVTDLAEHYAQIASYMRLMGMTPPSAQPRPAR